MAFLPDEQAVKEGEEDPRWRTCLLASKKTKPSGLERDLRAFYFISLREISQSETNLLRECQAPNLRGSCLAQYGGALPHGGARGVDIIYE